MTYKPLMFSAKEGKALIHIKDGVVEIADRDISRLYFMLSQVMDDADRQIVLMDLRQRGLTEKGQSR